MFEEHVTALFAIPKVAKSSAAHLSQVLDGVNTHLSAMLSLGDHNDIANAMLIHMVIERVDEDSQVKWEEAVDYTKLSSWDEGSAVLMKRCQNLEARESKLCPVDTKPTNNQRDYKNKRFNKTSLSVTRSSCTICHGSGHELPDCMKFKNLAVKDRSNAERKAKVCFRCLKGGHLYRDCSASFSPKGYSLKRHHVSWMPVVLVMLKHLLESRQ
ncbi:uncharacterized protein LOC119603818 [Lucilia sericata]|uniref:uncharacterized protein LOC119603818 n=1 Tax=Lucilia sericata TaxID=13632 RepID=UPI0018A868A7|nr:uncharacterized protein LOC119603818 [Lucilia sericata]